MWGMAILETHEQCLSPLSLLNGENRVISYTFIQSFLIAPGICWRQADKEEPRYLYTTSLHAGQVKGKAGFCSPSQSFPDLSKSNTKAENVLSAWLLGKVMTKIPYLKSWKEMSRDHCVPHSCWSSRAAERLWLRARTEPQGHSARNITGRLVPDSYIPFQGARDQIYYIMASFSKPQLLKLWENGGELVSSSALLLWSPVLSWHANLLQKLLPQKLFRIQFQRACG